MWCNVLLLLGDYVLGTSCYNAGWLQVRKMKQILPTPLKKQSLSDCSIFIEW